jgi:hypothetical protein
MEIFDKRFDWILGAGVTAFAVYLFYGIAPALITSAAIAALCLAKPINPYFEGRKSRAAVVVGSLLVLSPLFRVFFPDGFCLEAPLSINGFLDQVPTDGSALSGAIVNELGSQLVEYCKDNVWDMLGANGGQGYYRDIGYPLVGALLVFWGAKLARNHEEDVE